MEDIQLWTIRKNGLRVNIYSEPNVSQHRKVFALQGTIHAYNPFGDEKVTRIYANTTKELSKMAMNTAKRLFGII